MISVIKKVASSREKKMVLIVGDVMLDEYFFGSVSRISPEAPVPIIHKEKIEWSLGGAANVASNCKNIGLDVDLIGFINQEDRSGKKLIALLEEKKLSSSGLVNTQKRHTICKNRVMAGNYQLIRLDSEETFYATEKEGNELIKKIKNLIKKDSIILISDYSKGVISPAIFKQIVKIANINNCLVLVDPKGPDFGKYKNANYLKPNAKEFSGLVKYFNLDSQKPTVDNGREICKLLNLNGLIITFGGNGSQFVSKSDSIFVPANKKEVFDLTGAGDTVFAFLAFGFSYNLSIEQNLKIANLAASIAVSHLKTYSVSLSEVMSELDKLTGKIINDWSELKVKIYLLKKQGKKIIFTNGSFDILHSGHIYSLQEAKKQGDVLIVALNTDDSIKRYKGKDRPINCLADRAKLMESIGVVDFVTSFEQDTPSELIKVLLPDVLVKGGDYVSSQVAGYNTVTSNGGRVHIVNYQKGYSTTNLVNSIKIKESSV